MKTFEVIANVMHHARVTIDAPDLTTALKYATTKPQNEWLLGEVHSDSLYITAIKEKENKK